MLVTSKENRNIHFIISIRFFVCLRVKGTNPMKRHGCAALASVSKSSQKVTSFFNKVPKKYVAVTSSDTKMVSESCLRFIVEDIRPMRALAGDGLANLLSTFTSIGAKYGELNMDQIKKLVPHETTVSVCKVEKYTRSSLDFI